MFRFAKWVRTMCSFQAVSDALLSTLSPANLTKYWHLQHVHRFCISLPPPSFAWVWHNGIPLLHRTCPRAKQAERSQALCHKLSQDACETCEKNVQKEDPLPLKLAFQHYKEHSFKNLTKSPVCTCPPDDCLCPWYKQDPLTPCLLQAYSSPCHNDSGSESEPKTHLIAERYIVTRPNTSNITYWLCHSLEIVP